MEQTNMDLLIARLEKLEKHNRKSKFIGSALVLAIMALSTIAWTQTQIYKGSFTITDERGEVRGILFGHENGGSLSLGSDITEAHKNWIVIGHHSDGDPTLIITDKNGTTRFEVGYNTKGAMNIWLSGPNGKVIWQAIK